MLSPFGWASLAVLVLYLLLFFWGGALAARAAGRSVWLFGGARGPERWAATGFRAAFVIALFGPLLWLALPPLRAADPLWLVGGWSAAGSLGHLVAVFGALIAFAAQMSMGASWRVGVDRAAVGNLVSGGLYGISRNPTFLGQALLLGGIALAIPSIPTLLAVCLFSASASLQVRSEERLLVEAHDGRYRDYMARVPRWIGVRNGQEVR